MLNKNYSFIAILKPSSLTPSGYNWKELSQTSIDRIWIVVGAKRRQFSKLVITNFNTLMISYSSFVWRMILDARYCTVVATKTSSYIFTKVTCHSYTVTPVTPLTPITHVTPVWVNGKIIGWEKIVRSQRQHFGLHKKLELRPNQGWRSKMLCQLWQFVSGVKLLLTTILY